MSALSPLIARETARFIASHPKCAAQAGALAAHWLSGAPMHWMRDWASPFPIVVEDAEGATLTDIDDNVYDDFCLGDTPGMFGHGLAAVARAVAEQARRGTTYMLPTEMAAAVGALLAKRFGLPLWQATLSASDANRALIRWARAVTQKPVIVVFDGCYHGMVEDCFVELRDGSTRMDRGLTGQVHDMTRTTRAIPFNDLGALEAALSAGDVAALLAEPAMTNCGMILPEPGFHARLRALTKKAGALLILDETHTLSTGHLHHAVALGTRQNVPDHRLILDDQSGLAGRALNRKQFHGQRCSGARLRSAWLTTYQYSVRGERFSCLGRIIPPVRIS